MSDMAAMLSGVGTRVVPWTGEGVVVDTGSDEAAPAAPVDKLAAASVGAGVA